MVEHTARRHLPYSPAQLFDLVADVDRYAEFLPGVVSAHIARREGNELWVDMAVGSSWFPNRFTTHAVLDRPHRIDISSDDPQFERFAQTWTFEPGEDGGTDIVYRIEFVLRSALLQRLLERTFVDTASNLITSFKHRARAVYGPSGVMRHHGADTRASAAERDGQG